MRLVLMALLMLTGISYADTPEPPAAAAAGPKAVLIGPDQPVTPGSYVRVKTTGSTGKDFKLSVVPVIKNMDLVTFSDGSFGVTGQLVEPGTYIFALALNQDNKTDLVILSVIVKPAPQPDPPPIPSELESKLRSAYRQDGSPVEKKAYLVNIYRQMATEKAGSLKELSSLLAATCDRSFAKTELRATRDVATAYLSDKLGTKDGPVNVTIQADAFNNLATLLANFN